MGQLAALESSSSTRVQVAAGFTLGLIQGIAFANSPVTPPTIGTASAFTKAYEYGLALGQTIALALPYAPVFLKPTDSGD